MREDLMSVRLIDQWIEMISSGKIYNPSTETIVYMLDKLKEVIIEENQK